MKTKCLHQVMAIIIILSMLATIPQPVLAASQHPVTVRPDAPPPMPSSFYGEIHINDNPPSAGGTIEMYVPGVTGILTTATIGTYGTILVYAADVPGDLTDTPAKDGGVEGDVVTFMIGGRVVATGTWHSGTNTAVYLHPPQAIPGGPYIGDEGSVIDFNGSADDWGGDAASYYWDWENDGTYDEIIEDPSHTFAQDGTYTVGLKVVDAQGGEGTATVDVTVNNVAPTVNAGDDFTVAEDAIFNFAGTATDPADTLTYEWDFDYDNVTFDVDSSDSLTPSHAYAVVGDHTAALRATDDHTSTIDTVTVTVTNVNDPPVITGQQPLSTDEDVPLTITLADLIFDDPDSSVFTLTVLDGTNYTHTVDTITPALNFNGTLTVPVKVNDGEFDSNTFDLTVTVDAVNDTPVADPQSLNVDEDTPLAITLTGSDVETVSLIYAVIANPAHGTLSGTAPDLIYTPDANYNGADSFKFTVSDGALTSAEATISIAVGSVNDAPVAYDQNVTTDEDTPKAITLTANDQDNDPLTYEVLSGPSHGTLSGSAPDLTYSPDANYHGPDEFTFKARDGQADSNIATVSITVTSVNDAPTISNIVNQAILKNTTTGILAFTVNDVETPVDSLTVTATSSNQTLVPDSNITLGGSDTNRTIQVTPAADQIGEVTITVTVDDGTDTAVDTFLLTVWPELLYATPGGLTSGLCESWGNACELRYALSNSISGQEIWAMAGVYKPTSGSDRTATFQLKSGVGLYGGFAGTETARTQRDWDVNVTILSGDIDNNDLNTDGNFIAESIDDIQGANAYHVVTGSGTDNTAVLDGLVITAGQTVLAWSDNPAPQGGGMYNLAGSPTIAHVTFTGNSAGFGAGMYNRDSNPSLTDVTFIGNACHWDTSWGYGAGMYNHMSSPVLDDVRFINNSVYQDGGAMYNNTGSNPQLTNVTFIGNSAHTGAGMINASSTPTLTNVTFLGNTADSAPGIYNSGSSPTLTNVLFSGNVAAWTQYDYASGAISNQGGSNPVLTNVTFSHNFGGNAVIANTENSHPVMVNAIMWDSGLTVSGLIYNDATSNATVTYSNVEGGYPGTNNNDALPLFADADGADNIFGTADDDLRLLPGSPAIDVGDDASCPATDLRGLGRVGVCDLGAYEAQGFTLSIIGGNNQSAYRNTPFANPLQVSVAPNVTGEPVEGGRVTFTAPVSGASATISGSPATIASGLASVTATANGELGAYQVTAGASGANTAVFDLENINHVPTISNIPDQTTNEDTATGDIAFTIGDLDPADVLQVTATSSNQTLAPDENISLGGSGMDRTVNITPAADQNGTTTITITVDDGTNIASESFLLTVDPVNDAPEITGQVPLTTDEDVPLTITADDLIVTDVDNVYPGGFILTIYSGPNYTLTGNTITPDPDFNGTLTVPVQVNDGDLDSNIFNLTVTVNAVNDVPTAISQSVTTDEDTPLAITLAGSDIEGSDLSYAITVGPEHGILSGTAPDLTYTPDSNYHGPDSFKFTVNDGTLTSVEATVTITVNAVNDAPVITGQDTLSTEEDTPLTLTLDDLTVTDVDNTYPTGFSLIILDGANYSHAGSVITPASNFHGTLTVLVQVNDGLANSDAFDLSIAVVDLLPANVDAGGPYAATAGQAVTLTGSATCAPVDTCSYAWDLDSDGLYDDVTGTSPVYTWNTVGDYTIGLQVTDDDGNPVTDTASLTITPATHSIALVTGWNLVSFNLHPTNASIASVLSSIEGNYDLVYAWDATGAHTSSGNWLKYDNVPFSPDTLATLDETMGFWIHMTAADTLDIAGSIPASTNVGLFDNAEGWNLVSYPSMVDRVLPEALSTHGVGNDFSLVYAYHANDPTNAWRLFDINAPIFVNDLTGMSPGWGYWIKVSADHTWIVDYAAP